MFELETERQQLRKDHDALADRLASIPATREQERRRSARRYADPRSRWFPAAVTFLVPAAIAKGVRLMPPRRSSQSIAPNGRGVPATAKTIAQRHAEWVGLLRPDGPFIAVPVLTEAFPQGLDDDPGRHARPAPAGLVRGQRGTRHAHPRLDATWSCASCSATPAQVLAEGPQPPR